jgi:hypothetical protein
VYGRAGRLGPDSDLAVAPDRRVGDKLASEQLSATKV